jgi:ribulose-phosphate 3-epimerase
MLILPGILENKVEEFVKKMKRLEKNGVVRAHIDVIEPKFADNQTLYPDDWQKIPQDLEIDVHLMVKKPLDWLPRCVENGATQVVGHYEEMEDPGRFIKICHEFGVKAGVAIDLPTDLDDVSLDDLEGADQILVMSVKAGWSGQEFKSGALSKISALREFLGNTAEIVIDGGMNYENVQEALRAGTDGAVVSSWLWEDFEARLLKLSEIRGS